MYPVKLGFDAAIERIEKLSSNGHHAESIVTSVFTAEKTFRRTLKQLIVSCGFKSTIADKIINKLRGLDAIKTAWEYYDPDHKKLTDIISQQDWKTLKDNAERRNHLVHGIRVYSLVLCEKETENVVESLKNIKIVFEEKYGYSGWTSITIRKISKLHTDPRVEKTTGN